MEYTKGKLIFRTVLAAALNLLCILAIWFFVQGVITSLELDMAEYVWIWSVLIALLLIPLALCVRFALRVRRNWQNYLK